MACDDSAIIDDYSMIYFYLIDFLTACGMHRFGWDCEFQCGPGNIITSCRGSQFGLPDPYGSSCVSGYSGRGCDTGKNPSLAARVVSLVYQIPMDPAASLDIQAETVIQVRIHH